MVTDSSNQPGWGAKKGEGGGRVMEPVRPPTYYSGGYYTDSQGRQITREQAMQQGTTDRPGEFEEKAGRIGVTPQEYIRQSRQQGKTPEQIQYEVKNLALSALQQRIINRDPNISISESIRQSRDVYNFLQATQRGSINPKTGRYEQGATFAPGAEQRAARLSSKLGSVPEYYKYTGYERQPTFEDQHKLRDSQRFFAGTGLRQTAEEQQKSLKAQQEAWEQFVFSQPRIRYTRRIPVNISGKNVTFISGKKYPKTFEEATKIDFSSHRATIDTLKNYIDIGVSSGFETMYRGSVLSAYALQGKKAPKEDVKAYQEAAKQRYEEYISKEGGGKALDVLLSHPATAFIPVGAGWKGITFVGKKALGRAAYGLGEASIRGGAKSNAYLSADDFIKFISKKKLVPKDLVKIGATERASRLGKTFEGALKHQIPTNPFLATAKYGETAAAGYFIIEAYRGDKTPEQYIGKTAALLAASPGFRAGESIAVSAGVTAGKVSGLIPENVFMEQIIPHQSRTQVLENILQNKKIKVITATSGRGGKQTYIRSPEEIGDIGTGGVKGQFAVPEYEGMLPYGGYFTKKFDIGMYGLQRTVDIQNVRTSVSGKTIESNVLENIKDNKDIKQFADQYYKMLQDEANILNEPIAGISPKTFTKTAEAEAEVFIIYPTPKISKSRKVLVDIFGLKGATAIRKDKITIASSRVTGITTEGATIREVSYGKQPKIKGFDLADAYKNIRINVKNIWGDKWLERETATAKRKYAEERGQKPMIEGTYGQHGIQHSLDVLDKMGKWKGISQAEKRAAAILHDITKIGEQETTAFTHAKASARLLREGKLSVPEWVALTAAQKKNVARAIELHTKIKPFTAEALLSSPIEVINTIFQRPSKLAKALATADRESLANRFRIKFKPGLAWRPEKEKKQRGQKTKQNDILNKIDAIRKKNTETLRKLEYYTKPEKGLSYAPRYEKQSYAPTTAPYKQVSPPYTPKGAYKPPTAPYKLFGGYTPKGEYKPPTTPYKVTGMYKLESIYHPNGDYKPGGEYRPGGEYKPGGDYRPPAPPRKITIKNPPPSFEAQLSMLDKLKKKRGRFSWDINNPIPTLASLIGESEPSRKKKTKKSRK